MTLEPGRAPTVVAHLVRQAGERPAAPAFAVRQADVWAITSWGDYHLLVRRAARSLLALGHEPGDAVAILGGNRPEWTIGCLATMMAGGASVGVYQTAAPKQVGYVLSHAGARLAIVEDEAQLAKVREVRERLPALAHIVRMSGEGDGDSTLSWKEFLAAGDEVPEAELDARSAAVSGEDLATLIYTSGTTGDPKGVMLSHANLVETGRIGTLVQAFDGGDRLVSYLPLAHIAEQMLSIHMAVICGYAVYYVNDPRRLAELLGEIEPTVFFGVPRVWERVRAALEERLAAAGGLKGRLARWAVAAGRRAALGQAEGRVRPPQAFAGRLAERLVLRTLRRRLGFGKLRMAASGAAPLGLDVLEFYAGLGVWIFEVYGLSECCGPATWNREGAFRLGTVGRPLPEVEVRTDADGEILIRGPNVFQGYFRDPEASADALAGGWLHSGDLGALDEDGFLRVTGRKKELIITSGGKNVAPAPIEAEIKKLELVAEAVVIGDDRRFLSALLVLDAATAARFPGAREPFHQDPSLRAEIERGLGEVGRLFSRAESIRAFRLLPRELTVEAGELTPTLKVRRSVVFEHYRELIEEMYES